MSALRNEGVSILAGVRQSTRPRMWGGPGDQHGACHVCVVMQASGRPQGGFNRAWRCDADGRALRGVKAAQIATGDERFSSDWISKRALAAARMDDRTLDRSKAPLSARLTSKLARRSDVFYHLTIFILL